MKSCIRLASLESILPLYERFICCWDRGLAMHKAEASRTGQLLRYLQTPLQKQVYLLSSNGNCSREELAHDLTHEYGLDLPLDHIYPTSYLAAKYLQLRYPPAKNVYSIGTEGLEQEFTKCGFNAFGRADSKSVLKDPLSTLADTKAKNIDAVVVSYDNEFTAYKIFIATLAIQLGAKFLVTNRELSFPVNGVAPVVQFSPLGYL